MSELISRQAVLNYPIRINHYDAEHGNRDFVQGEPMINKVTVRWLDGYLERVD